MNNEDSGNELFGISEQLREKKHDPDCDCGICQYCNGTEDIYGNSTAPIKIANLEAELAALKAKLDAAKEALEYYAGDLMRGCNYGEQTARDALAIIDGTEGAFGKVEPKQGTCKVAPRAGGVLAGPRAP